tara:strand:+ start:7805 stop:8314 length:510 start_codon:yes stop_codon:yes gene_type:complete
MEVSFMKAILLIISTLILLSGCVTPQSMNLIPLKKDQTETIKIIDIQGVTKDELHERSKQFIADSFKSAQAVIQYESKEQGRIMGKGVIGGYSKASFGVEPHYFPYNFAFTIDVKDGKARFATSNYAYTQTNQPMLYKRELDMLKPELESLNEAFSQRMLQSASDTTNW